MYSEYVTASRNAEDARIGSGIIFGSFVFSRLDQSISQKVTNKKTPPKKKKKKRRAIPPKTYKSPIILPAKEPQTDRGSARS